MVGLPMPADSYFIRSLTPTETDTAVAWAAAEGWKPGEADMHCFLEVDPEGFLGGFIDGEMVSLISAIRYPGGFAFIGFYIVRPDYRGQGLGIRIWRAGMERVTGHNVGLDGVLAQEANYTKSGFARFQGNRRYECAPLPAAALPEGIVTAKAVPFNDIVAFDRRHFPGDRAGFLQAWLNQPGRVSLACVEDSVLTGYGVMRPCDGGSRIGPLFAETPEVAAKLLSAFRAAAGDGGVFLDVPTSNPAAIALAEKEGLGFAFETTRMYTQSPPDIRLEGVYGITSLELG